MALGSELNKVDQTIIRYADHRSAEEISTMLGGVISPAKVMARGQELIKNRNWLSATQEDELVLMKLRGILAELETRYLDNEGAGVQLRLLKEIGKRLDTRRAATVVDLETYDLNVAREMTRVYDIALGYMKGALRGDIDPELWDSVSAEALAHAGREVSKKAIEE